MLFKFYLIDTTVNLNREYVCQINLDKNKTRIYNVVSILLMVNLCRLVLIVYEQDTKIIYIARKKMLKACGVRLENRKVLRTPGL